jgi:drug/metabolite transporter (DMT)-like permease
MQGIGFALLSIVGMAALTLVLRAALETWPVGLAGTLSRVVTLAALGSWVLARRGGWRRLRPGCAGGWLVLMGLNSIVINLLLFASLLWTTATNNALLFRLDLVFVVLIGGLLGIERIGLKQLMLLPIMLVGVALVGEVEQFEWKGHLLGDLMVMAGALGFAVNAFVIRHILRTMDEESVALWNHSFSTLGFVVLAAVNGQFGLIGQIGAERIAWLWIVALGLVAAAALPLYYAALARMSVWRLRTWLLLTPVLVAVIEWPVWGTRLSASQCVGAAIILAGLAALIRIEARASVADTDDASTEAAEPAQQSELVQPTSDPSDRLGDQRKDKIA